jgi:O-methyltransferase
MIDNTSDENSLLDIPKLGFLLDKVNETKHLEGGVVEVGVYKGGSARVICNNLPYNHCYLIDTFAGLVDACEHDNVHVNGKFSETSIEHVKQVLAPAVNYTIIQSRWPDVNNHRLDNMQFKFVHLDVDMYVAYRENLDYFYPRLVSGGIILCDDYGCDDCLGAKKAIDEFVSSKQDAGIRLEFSRGLGSQAVIKRV